MPATIGERDLGRASARATLEGGVPQRVGPEVVLGDAGFADDGSPPDALVAVPDGRGGYAVAASLGEARARAGKVQGRSTGLSLGHPVDPPAGGVGPSGSGPPGWSPPTSSPTRRGADPGRIRPRPTATEGRSGASCTRRWPKDARRLADEYGRPVRVLWSREDVVRLGPKRPPVAGGVDRSGTGDPPGGGAPGRLRPGQRWEAVTAQVATVAPGLELEAVPLAGPPLSLDLRGAVWAEAAVLAAGARCLATLGPGAHHDVPVEVAAPGGGRAVARCRPDGSIDLEVDAGEVVDAVVLRSYCIGAAHQALGWVRSEGVAVDADGAVRDLTMRSFGILQARAMPAVTVTVAAASSDPAGQRVRRRVRRRGRGPVARRRPGGAVAHPAHRLGPRLRPWLPAPTGGRSGSGTVR